MDVGYTLKFQYDLSWFGNAEEITRARKCLLLGAVRIHKAKGLRFVDFIYEKDSEGKLHIHAHCRLDKKLYSPISQSWKDRYETFKIKGYTIKLEHAKNLPGWKKYMLKEVGEKGGFFEQGVAPSPTREAEIVQHASDIYNTCIRNEIQSLEKELDKLK